MTPTNGLFRRHRRSVLYLVLLFSIVYTIFVFQHGSVKVSFPASVPAGKDEAFAGGDDIDPLIQKVNAYLVQLQSLSEENVARLKLATQNRLSFTPDALRKAHKSFAAIFKVFNTYKPAVKSLDRYKSEERIKHAIFEREDTSMPPLSEDFLRKFIDVNRSELRKMQQSHSKVVRRLPESFPEGTFKGNGIVYVGGGKYSWLVLLSVRALRKLGSKLPVEIIIPKVDEYEPELCGKVFPELDAKCVLLPHVFGELAVKNFEFSGYQYKALALLASSFENVLLLDSDNVPVMKPDSFFDSEPYVSTGLICWPDYWKRATSPYFYDIAGVRVGKQRARFGYNNYGIYQAGIIANDEPDYRKIPLHDRKGAIPDPSTESGQLMVSKALHAKTLLVALYYNIWGPTHFYYLFSQGSDGQGDKETFLAAAVVLNKPYYQVNRFLSAYGRFKEEGGFQGAGMGQYDPVEDYKALQRNLKTLAQTDKKFTSYEEANNELAKIPGVTGLPLQEGHPKVAFVHANVPKINPVYIMENQNNFNSKGERIRMFGDEVKRSVGHDFELDQWQTSYKILCEEKVTIEAFKNADIKKVCKELVQQIQFLKNTAHTLKE